MKFFKRKSGKKRVKSKANGRPTIFEYYRDESASTIEFRRLARNINPNSQKSINSILITSAIQNEGKTLVAAHLAITIAKDEGENVLLIDFDMRRPYLHSLFGIERKAGLSSFLEGTVSLEKIIKHTELENLKVIPGGSRVSSPTHLLKKEKTKELMNECKSKFDFIICDAPPVIPVHDSEILSQYVDGVLFVVLAGKTFREVVTRATELLEEAHANVLGVVLNDVQADLPYYYHPRYYRHYYKDQEEPVRHISNADRDEPGSNLPASEQTGNNN